VTGTTAGLGQYLARALAKARADIAMTSRDEKTLADFSREIHAGRQDLLEALDVRDHESIQRAVAAIEEHFGRSTYW